MDRHLRLLFSVFSPPGASTAESGQGPRHIWEIETSSLFSKPQSASAVRSAGLGLGFESSWDERLIAPQIIPSDTDTDSHLAGYFYSPALWWFLVVLIDSPRFTLDAQRQLPSFPSTSASPAFIDTTKTTTTTTTTFSRP